MKTGFLALVWVEFVHLKEALPTMALIGLDRIFSQSENQAQGQLHPT